MEEDTQLRESLAELLTLEGFKVYPTGNGQAGLHSTKEYLPDLIICARMFIDMSCWEVLQSLQEEKTTRDIPFLFLSSIPIGIHHERMEKSKEAVVLTKPFPIKEFISIINSSLKL